MYTGSLRVAMGLFCVWYVENCDVFGAVLYFYLILKFDLDLLLLLLP